MMTTLLVAAGLVIGWMLASLIESLSHRHIQHAGQTMRTLYERVPVLRGATRHARFSHGAVHHNLTYQTDHVTQFMDGGARTERVIAGRGYDVKGFRQERFGVTLSLGGVAKFFLPFLAVWAPIALLAPLAFSAPVLLTFFVSPAFSKWLHPYLHMPIDACGDAPWWVRRLLHSPYGRWVWLHHFVHHDDPQAADNFNLLWGGDQLLGTSREPTPDQRRRARALGGPR